ncbi:hypothetical protein Tco_0356417 [Tanacetum coccineum]
MEKIMKSINGLGPFQMGTFHTKLLLQDAEKTEGRTSMVQNAGFRVFTDLFAEQWKGIKLGNSATKYLTSGLPKGIYTLIKPFIMTSKTFGTITSSNARNNATVQDGRVVVQDVCGRYNANNQGRPFQRNNARGNVKARNAGGQHGTRELSTPSHPQDSDYFKDKMLLMNAHENGAVLDEEQLLFLARRRSPILDDDVDDLAINVRPPVFRSVQCRCIDSDVDEVPTT